MNGNDENANPFSKELAWTVYQKNRLRIDQVCEMLYHFENYSTDENTLLHDILEIIGKMTDNTIFHSSIVRILNNR